ncbi:glutathione S-transferase family protein [Aquabacterium sp. OR-4]|uniref:glutathione S-transferase family protein n=1 Tax=Aquabacterium sp. OR-4 TaxID=2978127 RepID=UPI0021B3731D|nr:glutathione S-transferase family protein [Aquabacterium sp. OR-4]MDT7837864.1 glutathione S-transferase family protein [Aquabacterium sp. OR-4]
MPAVELISNLLCPYSQRIAIQLMAKGLAFERVFIDLAAKPDWFVAAAPLGKVPLLRVAGHSLFETSVICDYVEDQWPEQPMLAAAPLARARQRAWTAVASAMLADVFAFYSAPDAAGFDRAGRELAARFNALERQLALGRGPFFDDAGFGLVDAAFAPVFTLFDSFDRIADFGVMNHLPRVADYRAALAGQASVQQAALPAYGHCFEHYLASRSSHLARRMAAVR